MSCNAKVVVKFMPKLQEYILSLGIGGFSFAKSEVRIYYLLYATKVCKGDDLFVFNHLIKSMHTLAKTG